MPKRGTFLTIAAVLFAVLAVSNLLKPMEFNADHGFVFLGSRLKGTLNMVIAPLFGLYVLIYALGIWRMKRYALLMGRVYAAYVIVNLILFQIWGPKPQGVEPLQYALFGLLYALVAIGLSSGTAYVLGTRQAELS